MASEQVTPGPQRAGRLFFGDNIRVLLTILVILHHLMIIYAGSGGWIHMEGREDEITNAVGSWFCASNQAYFMGLFLLISAYFVPGSYDRKGPARFLADRLIRLGIPLAVYGWIVRPLFIYYVLHRGGGLALGSWYRGAYFRDYGLLGGGPLWFIELLLIFSLVYVAVRLAARRYRPGPPAEGRFPGGGRVALFALLRGVVTFNARLEFPVNSRFEPLNLQFGNFAQYIALFAAGLVAYRRNNFARHRPAGGGWRSPSAGAVTAVALLARRRRPFWAAGTRRCSMRGRPFVRQHVHRDGVSVPPPLHGRGGGLSVRAATAAEPVITWLAVAAMGVTLFFS